MSTEHQRYSTQNQAEALAKYAAEHGMTIVRTFADDGKSGLNLEGRAGLLRLLSEVQNGLADFSAILVYDISRWGRFQDADESGYWEYVCKRAGVAIHYCAEQFANDGSMSSVILKNLKRTMAGEYSRELSVKVFAGQCRLIEIGYRQGGPAGFGLRRLLIDQENRPKEVLGRGTRKSLQTDRVVLVPGPEEEQKVVQEIYREFVGNGKPG
jgi:DNA invertase Pin-like site-specific DNA recombinase